MLRRQFFTRTIGALVGAVCAGFVGKAKPPTSNLVDLGRPFLFTRKDGVYVTYDGKKCMKVAHYLEFAQAEPLSPASHLFKLDELVNNIYRKQAEQARLAADPGAT